MAKPKKRVLAAKKEPFPWLLFVAFLVSIYVFWVLPRQLGSEPPKVDFANPKG